MSVPRIAFLGDADRATMRAVVAVLREMHGDFVALVAELGPAALRELAPTSHYYADLATHNHAARDEARDRDMLHAADLAVALPGAAPRACACAAELGVPVWHTAREAKPPALRRKGEMDMTASPAHQFLWIDVETTGLDPHAGRVLEFAIALCEDARGDDFAIVQQYAGVIGASAAELDALAIDDFVKRMHERNGLWSEALASTTTAADVDTFLLAVADSLAPGRKRAIRLAGSSVHFDLAWCRVHFPLFAERLSHRVLDVRTLRAACDAWAPAPIAWPKRDAHRALPDVLATIAEARVARAAMFGGTP